MPKNYSKFVSSFEAAEVLGKAMFWDVQVGSDGVTACATCHHASGVDQRTTNTMHPGPNGIFEIIGAGGVLAASDFPFHGTDDISGSQGVDMQMFMSINNVPDSSRMFDNGMPMIDEMFGENRQVTERDTPTMINAIFNEVSFWDGRAVKSWNGVTVGKDKAARVYEVRRGVIKAKRVKISPASAASQAVGPTLSGVEMSWMGRNWPQVGMKMLPMRALAMQKVAKDDSVLGQYATGDTGINMTYEEMIMRAFPRKYWDSEELVTIGGVDYSLMAANFTFFWGMSVLTYESTLVSDQTPFDNHLEGNGQLTRAEKRGMNVFEGKGRCDHCHGGATLTGAAKDGNGKSFANIGVRPTSEDPGRKNGEFKVPGLRNVELTGPYFHTGSYLTLRQLVEFYNRGGDFDNKAKNSQIRKLKLSNGQLDDLVSFLLSLTDDRVRHQKAPFDHPEIALPNGDILPAVGAGGGDEVKPYLNVNHRLN
jgi:cytochrome c peroxidase